MLTAVFLFTRLSSEKHIYVYTIFAIHSNFLFPEKLKITSRIHLFLFLDFISESYFAVPRQTTPFLGFVIVMCSNKRPEVSTK